MDWAETVTDALKEFLEAGALACLSAAAGRSLRLNSRIDANLWLVLIGESSVMRKSTATSLARTLCEEAGIPVFPDRITPESFYYRCSGTADAGAGKRCRAKLTRAKDIKGAVWEDIREFLRNLGAVVELLQAPLERGRESLIPLERELAEAERAVSEVQAARARVLSLCARGLVTMEEAERELAALGAEATALAARRDALFARLESLKAVQARALDARLLLERLARRLDALDEEDRSSLVRGLVERGDVFTEEVDGIRRSRAVIRYCCVCQSKS